MSQMIQKGEVIDTFATLSRPRTIKTHLPVQLLPDDVWTKKPKMIYCSRDPRDVAVSLYHFGTHYDNVTPMVEVLRKFLNDQVIYSPYREHRLNFWNIPDYQNILYLTYEFVTSNINETIQKVSKFLNVDISDENFLKLKVHLRFEKMKSMYKIFNASRMTQQLLPKLHSFYDEEHFKARKFSMSSFLSFNS
jgi:hypothetical protein